MTNSRLAHFSAGRVILIALFCTILLGTLLLALPIARHVPMHSIDLLFTATSMTCVTGLFTVPIENFTFFGHCVILGLIQVGGLGIITLTLFLLSLFVNLGLATQLMAGRLLELESWKNTRKLLFFIVGTALMVEAIGAALFFTVFIKKFPFGQALFFSIFHSVSFFCSAGITLFGNSLNQYAHNYTIILTASALMLVGGLGFVTLYELIEYVFYSDERKHHFSLQTKIVLVGTAAGVLLTTIVVYLLERHNAFRQFSTVGSIITSIFESISFRSTGLLTIPLGEFQLATIFIILLVSFIGSAPGSTGSGIRITTLAVYIAVVKAAIEAHTSVNVGCRRIARDQVNKAIAILSLSMFWVIITTFCLLTLEPNWRFIDVFFEAISAFTNVGLTLGITPFLSVLGKLLIIASMIVGRIGSLTLILALRKIALRSESQTNDIMYPEERIMLS